MIKQSLNLAVTVWLAAHFLTASTILTGTIAHHAHHHGHDQQSHSQTWCGWMCAAGQAIEAPSIYLAQNHVPIGWAFTFLSSLILLILNFSPGSRGPPIASL